MRFLYVKLTGYIGIYNGLGLTQIKIDFTKSRNRICVITGPNGSGKSTLLNALNILPDGSENFVPTLSASKQLRILDEGTVYDIFINHPLDGKGNRAVTKVSIKKNGIELNPNGNVSSYKDIIFSEFDLDSNFITLTHLSGDDRGLADKKPAERKKFLASITSSLETYNGIYKNLNKKGNVYKSYINGLTGKISNIGDENSLLTTKTALSNRLESLSNQIEQLKAKVIQQQTIASINDPNGELQNTYLQLEQQINLLEKDYTTSITEFDRFCSNNKIANRSMEVLKAELAKQLELQTEHQKALDNGRAALSIILNDIKNINENLEKDTAHIMKLESEITPDLSSNLESTKARLDQIQKDFNEVGINDPNDITTDNIQQVIKTIKLFIDSIDYIYENLLESKLPEFAGIIKSGESIHSIIDKNVKNRESINQEILNLTGYIAGLEEEINQVTELEKRPDKCKLDACPYLYNSMSVLKKHNVKKIEDCKKIIGDLIREASNKITLYNQQISESINYGETLQSYLPMETSLDRVRTIIDSNYDLFAKIGVITPLLDFNAVLDKIAIGDRFNEFRDIKVLTYLSNDLIEYKSISVVYTNLLSEYKANQNNIEALAEYKRDYEQLNEDLAEKYIARDNQSKDNQFVKGVLEKATGNITMYSDAICLLDICNKKNADLEELKKQYKDIQRQFEGSSESIKIIHDFNIQIQELAAELKPIEDQKKEIDSRLLLLDSYRKEFAEYNEKYEMINTLKKYSSPTAGGIQTFFMNLYMGKTLELANQLLGMIFQGQYQLLDYVITADEFRMPFIGSGLAVDDITSGSTSQVCIMGMIINLSLLNQASTKFNITRLDEIDGGLDYSNRAVFMQILQRVIDILGIEQLFIISHNMESYNGGTDAIQLAPIEGMDNNANGSNVIYHY